jgi:ABC-type amino acid transport substrate-binding protein
MKTADGRWSGIAIDLWRNAAGRLGYQYRFKETTLDGLLKGTADHSLDAAVAAVTRPRPSRR